jgi:purine-nucleoside phosphorylase
VRGPGTVVLLRDHINLTGANPLVGARFIDMTEAYSARLRDLARSVDPSLTEGVYAQFHGPSFETPSEVRMAGVLGADLVGMSTGLETIAARELGAEVLGLSLVTNLAAGISPAPLHHEEVLEAGAEAAPRLRALLAGLAAAL